MDTGHESSLKTLQDIRSIMERSTRFISLSGWSGIWAGATALAGSFIAYQWLLQLPPAYFNGPARETIEGYYAVALKFVLLALAVFVVAFAGAYFFTWRKTRRNGGTVWNTASRRMMAEIALPMVAGGIFALKFITDREVNYIAPACLAFYGLALINGSKYTLSDIKYLGLLEVTLGCICLFVPEYGLSSMGAGFGVLHILYGIMMWNKYDKHSSRENAG